MNLYSEIFEGASLTKDLDLFQTVLNEVGDFHNSHGVSSVPSLYISWRSVYCVVITLSKLIFEGFMLLWMPGYVCKYVW